MHILLFAVMSPRAMKFLFGCKVGVLLVIACIVLYEIFMAWRTGKLLAAYVGMKAHGKLFWSMTKRLLLKLRGYLAMALGAYDPVQVNHLIYRAALLSQQASSGKFSPGMKHVVLGQIGYVQQAICALDKTYAEQFRRKPHVQCVEIVNGPGEGMELSRVDSKDGKVCDSYLLAAPAGPQG